jgi:hypothetical protein
MIFIHGVFISLKVADGFVRSPPQPLTTHSTRNPLCATELSLTNSRLSALAGVLSVVGMLVPQ